MIFHFSQISKKFFINTLLYTGVTEADEVKTLLEIMNTNILFMHEEGKPETCFSNKQKRKILRLSLNI